jgi:hypothetical protein
MFQNEHDGAEVLRWDAFTLIKLHHLVEKILRETGLEIREVYQVQVPSIPSSYR